MHSTLNQRLANWGLPALEGHLRSWDNGEKILVQEYQFPAGDSHQSVTFLFSIQLYLNAAVPLCLQRTA